MENFTDTDSHPPVLISSNLTRTAQKIDQLRKKLLKSEQHISNFHPRYSGEIIIKLENPILRGSDIGQKGVSSSRRGSLNNKSNKIPMGIARTDSVPKNKKYIKMSSFENSASGTPNFNKLSVSEKKMSRVKEIDGEVIQNISKFSRANSFINTPSANSNSVKEIRKLAIRYLHKVSKEVKEKMQQILKLTITEKTPKKGSLLGKPPLFHSEKRVTPNSRNHNIPIRMDSYSPGKKKSPHSSFYIASKGSSNEIKEISALDTTNSSAYRLNLITCESPNSEEHKEKLISTCRNSSESSDNEILMKKCGSQKFLESIEKLATGPLYK